MKKKRPNEETNQITEKLMITSSSEKGPSLSFMINRIPEMLCGMQRHHVEFVYFYLLRAQK